VRPGQIHATQAERRRLGTTAFLTDGLSRYAIR